MKFPWHRKKDDDAARVLDQARQHLEDARRQWPAVRRAAASMDRHREHNGFADAIRTAMGVRDT